MGGFGSVGSMESVRKENSRLRSSVKKYRNLRKHYIGSGNENSDSTALPKLTENEIKAGRARAVKYIKERNRINRIIYVVVSMLVCILVYLSYLWILDIPSVQNFFNL